MRARQLAELGRPRSDAGRRRGTPDAKDLLRQPRPGFCGVAGSMGHAELVEALSGKRHCACWWAPGCR